jgi:beta-glucosidase
VLGPAADDVRHLQGDYSYPAHVEIAYAHGAGGGVMPTAGGAFTAEPWFPESVTPLAGMRAAVAPGTQVTYAKGCEISGNNTSGLPEAVAAAHSSDVAIVCVGGKSGLLPDGTSGEFRDASDLGSPACSGS